jgi:hypothetical protein
MNADKVDKVEEIAGNISEKIGFFIGIPFRMVTTPGFRDWLFKPLSPLVTRAEERKIHRGAVGQLRYTVKQFEGWHKLNCPELSVEEALKKYPGITLQELIDNAE